MAESDGSVTRWIEILKAGGQTAAEPLWERYFARLVRIADSKLNTARHLGVCADGEDAALSAIGSLFNGVSQGKYSQLSNRDDLWNLLVVLTARKAFDQIAKARTQKRGGGRVVNESVLETDPKNRSARKIEDLPGNEPTPEFTVMVLEQCRKLLEALPDDQFRNIAVWRMEGYTRQEIAQRLGCSARTVTYKLEYIRKAWESHER